MNLNNLTRFLSLSIPTSSSIVDLKIIKSYDSVAQATVIEAGMFIAPAVRPLLVSDVYAFVVENQKQKRRVMFDLGLRKDPRGFPPGMIPDDVPSQLVRGNVSLESFESVIWSHSHPDHVGDMFLWPNSTSLVIGEATDTRTFPTFENATLLDTDFAGKTVIKVSFQNSTLNIGGFAAVDYFRDGSFYLLDSPGHHPGNLMALARVTRTTFVLLSGDTFHHVAQIRPSPDLRKTYPIPRAILQDSRENIARDYFFAPNDHQDLSNKNTPFLTVASNALYFDPAISRIQQLRLGVFDSHPDILILAAHDPSIRDLLDFFPKSVNAWKEKRIKERGVWNFANSSNVGYQLAPN